MLHLSCSACVRACNRINTPFTKGSPSLQNLFDNLLLNYFPEVYTSEINFLPYMCALVINISIDGILISVVNIAKLIH